MIPGDGKFRITAGEVFEVMGTAFLERVPEYLYINPENVRYAAWSHGVGIYEGTFDLERVRSGLRIHGFDRSQYKDVEIWKENDESVALLDGVVLWGRGEGVENCIKVIGGEEKSFYDDERIRKLIPHLKYKDIVLMDLPYEYSMYYYPEMIAASVAGEMLDEYGEEFDIQLLLLFDSEESAEEVIGGVKSRVENEIVRYFEGYQNVSVSRERNVIEILVESLRFGPVNPYSAHDLHRTFSLATANWRIFGLENALQEICEWLETNTPDNSIFSIQWSFGNSMSWITGRTSVAGVAQKAALEGAWENDPSFVPKPPDCIYIYVIEEGEIEIFTYGIEAWRRPYRINGRRTDVEWFPRITPHELEYYLREYRDEWGVRIDYIIFSIDEYRTAANLYAGSTGAVLRNHDSQQLDLRNLLFGRGEPEARTDQFIENDNKLIFDFGGKGRVILDPITDEVYLEDGRRLQGHALLEFEGGEIIEFDYFAPPETPQVYETLIVFQDDVRGIFEAWLVKNPLGEYLEAGYPAPYPQERVGVKAFEGNLDDVEYLDLVFRSTNGQAVVLEVDHRLI
jgi:hypothetical protein